MTEHVTGGQPAARSGTPIPALEPRRGEHCGHQPHRHHLRPTFATVVAVVSALIALMAVPNPARSSEESAS